MKSLLVLLAAAGIASATLSPSTPNADEPPLRAEVRIGDETYQVVLGEPTATTDGESLVVELLPQRVFQGEGSFSLPYPREWDYSGASQAAEPWWNLRGPGEVVHIRRHSQDAQEIVKTYADNLQLMGGSTPEPFTFKLDGKVIAGVSVQLKVGNMRGGPSDWVQEVFGWTDDEGNAWMISVQRDITAPAFPITPLIVLDLEGQPVATQKVPVPAERKAGDIARDVLREWKWN